MGGCDWSQTCATPPHPASGHLLPKGEGLKLRANRTRIFSVARRTTLYIRIPRLRDVPFGGFNLGSMRGSYGRENTVSKAATSELLFADMSVLELNDEHVISIVRQLPAGNKCTALLALAHDPKSHREERLQLGAAQLRRMCATRGLDWDRMSEDERETLVDDLLNEL